MVRLMVATTIMPPGFSMAAQLSMNSLRSATCSTTSMLRMTSKRSPAAASASAVVAR